MALFLPNQPGWTEMFLPLQVLEVGNVHIEEPKLPQGPGIPAYAADRPLAALSYKNTSFTMPCLSIITPFLRVFSWDPSTGRLELEADPASLTYIKCTALQDMILDLLEKKPQWLAAHGIRTAAELRFHFQNLMTNNIMTIYLHGQNPDKKTMGRVWIWKEGIWQKGASMGSFRRGQELRVAMRLQGVCFLPTQSGKTRCRLQHQTVAIFLKNSSS